MSDSIPEPEYISFTVLVDDEFEDTEETALFNLTTTYDGETISFQDGEAVIEESGDTSNYCSTI